MSGNMQKICKKKYAKKYAQNYAIMARQGQLALTETIQGGRPGRAPPPRAPAAKSLMKVFWSVRSQQGHKSAGDTQFIRMLRWL